VSRKKEMLDGYMRGCLCSCHLAPPPSFPRSLLRGEYVQLTTSLLLSLRSSHTSIIIHHHRHGALYTYRSGDQKQQNFSEAEVFGI
jgi:hypothetical protein